MKYQPKVSITQKYSDSQGEHIVHEGKLILITGEKYHTFVKKSDGTLFKPTKISEVENGMNWVKPIIISETEEIEKGDWVYNHDTKEIFYLDFFKSIKGDIWSKILALPEHFSDKHLQAIVDGKMKDRDSVFLKIEWKGGFIHDDVVYENKEAFIHLDHQNHITLFPAEQSLEEVAKKFVKDVSCFTDEEAEHFDPLLEKSFIAGAKWAKKNNY